MYAASDALLAQVRGPHRIATKVEYSKTGVGGPWIDIEFGVVKGSVTFDRGSDIRRRLSITFVGWTGPQDLNPWNIQEALSPYDTLIKPYRGVILPGGEVELIPLGVYRVYESTMNQNSLDLVGYSQDVDLRDARFTAPWSRPYWVTGALSDEIELMLLDALPDAVFSFAPGLQDPNVATIQFDRDRLDALNTLCRSAGGELVPGRDGEFQVRAPNTGAGSADWIVNAGPDGVLIEYSRFRTREGVYNGAVVTGEGFGSGSSGTAAGSVRVVMVDEDPTSPTYWYGQFGKVPIFYSSQYIYTRDQAVATAESLLASQKGLSTSADFSALPNPALDVDDLIEVVYPDGTRELHIVDKLEMGLGSDEAMSGTTRFVRLIDPDDLVPDSVLDGGTPTTTSWEMSLDGGTPSTAVWPEEYDGGDIAAAPPTSSYDGGNPLTTTWTQYIDGGAPPTGVWSDEIDGGDIGT